MEKAHCDILSILTGIPRWVQTDIGNRGADAFGYEQAAITVDKSVAGMMKVIDIAKRETHGGKLWTWEGKESPW